MEELLKKLLEAQILTEDTKKDLENAFNTKLNETINSAKAAAEVEVRAQLTEKWITERDALISALDLKVESMLKEEVEELKEDFDRFRDLEAEYAQRIVEAKAEMGEELKADLKQLVENLDSFLEIRLRKEVADLREDIATQKQNNFGRKIVEAFAEEFESNYFNKKKSISSLKETQKRLKDTSKSLVEAADKLAALRREVKMKEILNPLKGPQREMMEMLLKNVDTKNLTEGYKTFIGRVIRNGEEVTSEKETQVLAEGNKPTKLKESVQTKTVSGNSETLVESGQPTIDLAHWKKMAGI